MAESYSQTEAPLIELAILKKAYRLLLHVELLTKEDEALIAGQVRNILRWGCRHPDHAAEEQESPSLETPTDTPDASMDDWLDLLTRPGCTLEERVAQLGYQLTIDQYKALIPRVANEARRAWQVRFEGEPVHLGEDDWLGHDWYGMEDFGWLDPVITAYLDKFPRITRVQAQED